MVAIIVFGIPSCKKQESNNTKAVVGEVVDGYFKCKQPFKLSVVWIERVNVIEPENTPVLTKATEYTNISLENILQSSTKDLKQTLSFMVSLGKLPDIIHANGRRNLLQYAGDGTLIPLDELVDQYAPNIKRYFKQNTGVYKKLLSTDGKIYYILSIADGDVSFG